MKNRSKEESCQLFVYDVAPQNGLAPTLSNEGGACTFSPVTPSFAVDPLLYLYSNNCIETSETEKENLVKNFIPLLSPYHRKSAHTLSSNVSRLITSAPSVGHIGFMTLTFADNVTDHKEASSRFHSFNTNFLLKHPEITHWINTKERQKRGSWHYHLIITLREDIKENFNFEEVAQGNYSSASNYLRTLWRDLREACKKYGFGRSELLPVKSNAEAMGRYIGKYISKHIDQRETQDKGVRLVNSSQGWLKNSVNFAWYTEGSVEWRKKLALFAQFMGCTEIYQLTERLGSGWAYNYASDIINIEKTLELNALQPDHVAPEIIILQEAEKRNAKRLNCVRHHKTPRVPLDSVFAEYKKEIPLVDALWEEYSLKKKKKPSPSGGSPSGLPF